VAGAAGLANLLEPLAAAVLAKASAALATSVAPPGLLLPLLLLLLLLPVPLPLLVPIVVVAATELHVLLTALLPADLRTASPGDDVVAASSKGETSVPASEAELPLAASSFMYCCSRPWGGGGGVERPPQGTSERVCERVSE
jgi:hypothetical protein